MGGSLGLRFGRISRFALPLALAVVGWSAADSAALPSAEELVPNTVARIFDVPDRAGTITRAEFRHGLVVAAAAKGLRAVPKPGNEYERLKHIAVDNLLEAVWVKGQAVEMSIVVTHGQVSRRVALLKKESFESAAEYREFLREARFTRSDVYERVELQLLSVRILRRATRGARSEFEEQEILDEFLAEFNERWRGRTVCATGYVTDRCSNGPRSD